MACRSSSDNDHTSAPTVSSSTSLTASNAATTECDRVSDELSMNSRIEAATDKPAHYENRRRECGNNTEEHARLGKAEELSDLFERLE